MTCTSLTRYHHLILSYHLLTTLTLILSRYNNRRLLPNCPQITQHASPVRIPLLRRHQRQCLHQKARRGRSHPLVRPLSLSSALTHHENEHRISGDATHRADVVKMAEWLNEHLKAVGVSTQLVDLGKHTMDGEELNLPPAILGRIGDDKAKKTVLVYGHFDVQPVSTLSFVYITYLYGEYRHLNRMDGTLIRSR